MTCAANSAPIAGSDHCLYCEEDVKVVVGTVGYINRSKRADRNVWRNVSCDALVGRHRDDAKVTVAGSEIVVHVGTLLPVWANKELKATRIASHRLFSGLWQGPARMTRNEAKIWTDRIFNLFPNEAHIKRLSAPAWTSQPKVLNTFAASSGHGRPEVQSARIVLHIQHKQQGRRLDEDMGSIHDTPPRETAGRETILRFGMQFQAAAYAALEILSGSEVDRVYCDYVEDFVVRRSSPAGVNYHFFQVKTKDRLNKQWTLLEIFSLRQRGAIGSGEKLEEVRDSIAGKLFAHTITFGDQCRAVTILSNVHFDDAVLNALTDLQAGGSEKKPVAELIERFGEIFAPSHDLTPEALKSARAKLGVAPAVDHIGESLDRFTSAARTAIWTHSEIDLRPQEVDEIARSLVGLVMSKSCTRISGLSKQQLEQATSVGLKELLEVLSISTPVYETLRSGEDPKAIKSASILQRQLKQAGATDSMVETASRLKVEWDIWLRTSRHVYTEMALESLLQEIETTCSNWLLAGGRLADLQKLLSALSGQQWMTVFKTLSEDLLFGAVLSAMVRRGAR